MTWKRPVLSAKAYAEFICIPTHMLEYRRSAIAFIATVYPPEYVEAVKAEVVKIFKARKKNPQGLREGGSRE